MKSLDDFLRIGRWIGKIVFFLWAIEDLFLGVADAWDYIVLFGVTGAIFWHVIMAIIKKNK